MSEFLRELGYDPARYWLFAGVTFLLWLASAFVPSNPGDPSWRRLNRPGVFGALLLIALFAWRWPLIYHFKPVNPDESQFLAAAITALARGNIWWSDAMTSGPLVVLPLTVPGLLGLPIDFTNGRIVGLLLTWSMIWFCYLTLRHLHGDRKARLLVMPLAALMIFLLFWDFVPYCSERSPLFLCSLAIWLLVSAFRPDGAVTSRWRLASGGFVIGLMPFSKFQVIPLGAAIGLSAFWWVLCQPENHRAGIRRDLVWLIGSVVAGFGLMIVSIWLSGQGPEVFQAYLVHNLHYTKARGLPWTDSGYILSYLTDLSWGFKSYHLSLLGLLAFAQWGLRRSPWRPLLLFWSLLAVTYFAVLTPGRLYPHYLMFLALPLGLVVGVQFGYLLNVPSRLQQGIFWTVFLCLGTGTQLVDRVWDRQSMHKLIAVPNAKDQVVAFINRTKHPGDSLAVWGWRPELYIETQMPQATREALTEAQLNPNPQRDYFRARLLADLHANQPAFFVDSVGPADYLLKDQATQGHDIVPELKAYVAQNYTQVAVTQDFRLYVRRDRLAEIK